MLVLSGIAVIVAGFLLRFNPLLVVAVSALVTGLAAGLAPLAILAAFGKAFNENRYVTVIYIVLPVIGLLERHGLQERARLAIAKLRGATVGRLLIGYLLFRQLTAALGLTSIAGPAQSVRPLVAPMAEAAAEAQGVAPGGDRQYRALLRRGHLHRDRVDPADEGRARRLWHRAGTVPAVGVGDPHRDRRVPDPRLPPLAA